MPSIQQLASSFEGTTLFSSKQDDIVNFLGAGDIADYAGVCLALVMLWLGGDSSKTNPLAGIKNKVAALQLQAKMESSWAGFDTVASIGAEVIGKSYWWRSESKHVLADDKGAPAPYLENDPQYGREGLHVLVLYFPEGPGHAVGAWRFPPSGTMVLYDPNHGACVLPAKTFRGFLAEFIREFYPDADDFAVCSFYYAPA